MSDWSMIAALLVVNVLSSWIQRTYGWVIWGALLGSIAFVWLVWKVAPL